MSNVGFGSQFLQDNDQEGFTGRGAAYGAQQSELSDLIHLSRARKVDLIAVSGPSGLELLGALFRSGYEQVVCATSGFPSAHEQVDALLMAGHHSVEVMTQGLRRLAPHLKEGGVLTCELPSFEDDRQVELCLSSLGLSIESTVFDLRSKILVRHTVGHEARLLRAA